VARARRGEPVDGVLLLDKPSGITSNAALQRARRLFGAAKAGHTGTLDPLASGLLPITFGEATKFSADLLDAAKEYEAHIALGTTTDTGDAAGRVIAVQTPDVSRAQLLDVLHRFVGAIEQVPPMYSALKRDGRPLYAYARAGQEVERAARAVTIHLLELLDLHGATAHVRVACSKGTYVRVLAEDIGRQLGCGAHLAALRRTRVGDLWRAQSTTLEALEAVPAADRNALLQPLGALVARLPRVDLDPLLAERFRHGQRLALGRTHPAGRVRVLGPHEQLLGIALVDAVGVLAPQRLVRDSSPASKTSP